MALALACLFIGHDTRSKIRPSGSRTAAAGQVVPEDVFYEMVQPLVLRNAGIFEFLDQLMVQVDVELASFGFFWSFDKVTIILYL